jgi:hypothetical protein
MEVRFPIIGNDPEIDVANAAMSFRWAASASLDPAVNSSCHSSASSGFAGCLC